MIADDRLQWKPVPQPTGADGLRVLPVGRAGRPSYVPPCRRPNVHRFPLWPWAVAAGGAIAYLLWVNWRRWV